MGPWARYMNATEYYPTLPGNVTHERYASMTPACAQATCRSASRPGPLTATNSITWLRYSAMRLSRRHGTVGAIYERYRVLPDVTGKRYPRALPGCVSVTTCCQGGDVTPWCKLCHHSPTYWRLIEEAPA